MWEILSPDYSLPSALLPQHSRRAEHSIFTVIFIVTRNTTSGTKAKDSRLQKSGAPYSPILVLLTFSTYSKASPSSCCFDGEAHVTPPPLLITMNYCLCCCWIIVCVVSLGCLHHHYCCCLCCYRYYYHYTSTTTRTIMTSDYYY